MIYDILKDFPGSQDGRFSEQFTAGTQRDLSDYLAAIAVPNGWARLPVDEPAPAPAPATAPVVEPVAEEVKIAKVPTMKRGR